MVILVDERKYVRKIFQHLLCIIFLKLYACSQGFTAFYSSLQDLFL